MISIGLTPNLSARSLTVRIPGSSRTAGLAGFGAGAAGLLSTTCWLSATGFCAGLAEFAPRLGACAGREPRRPPPPPGAGERGLPAAAAGVRALDRGLLFSLAVVGAPGRPLSLCLLCPAFARPATPPAGLLLRVPASCFAGAPEVATGAFFGGVFLPGAVSVLPSFAFVLFVRSFAIPHPLSCLCLLPATLTHLEDRRQRDGRNPPEREFLAAHTDTELITLRSARTDDAVSQMEDQTREYVARPAAGIRAGATLQREWKMKARHKRGLGGDGLHVHRTALAFISQAFTWVVHVRSPVAAVDLDIPCVLQMDGCSVVDTCHTFHLASFRTKLKVRSPPRRVLQAESQ